MPIFGNNVAGAAPGYLNDSLFGHFDITFMASWGLPVPACVVKMVSIYACGSAAAETSVLQFGIYDASAGPPYNTWPLLATTPTVSIPGLRPVQWWPVVVNIPLAAGSYALAVLDINGPVMTFSAGVYMTTKVVGMSQKSPVGGVFPNPLGVCTATNLNHCLYADYVLVGRHTPTAAAQCQPKCGEG